MDILSALQLLNNAEGMQAISKGVQGAGQAISDQFDPIKQMIDDSRFKLADQMGMTKTMVDPGDASEYKAIDEEQMTERMGNLAETANAMRPQIPQGFGLMERAQMQMPAQMMQSPNAYSQVNYGAPQYQQPTGGIGSAPSMEQILRALQSQQR